MTVIEHPSVDERRGRGKAAREHVAPSGHAGWVPAADRPDPVALLEEQNVTREPDLVPVRHGRMMVSPFTFYRGAAKIMAADLKDTPTAGLDVQLCGDAHLSNFGVFASPERTLVFDLNDFDETLPGPFEYDVKRMAASFTIAARNNGFTKADARAATITSVTAYREAMAEFAEMPTLDIWYARLSEQDLMRALDEAARSVKSKEDKRARRDGARRPSQKAHTRDSLQALSKLAELVDGEYRIVSQPPIVVPARDLVEAFGISPDEIDGHDPRAVPRLPRDAAGRSPPPARAVRAGRRGPQGRRCRQRRHPGVHRPAAGPRPTGSVVPAGQGSDRLGARGSPAQEPLPPARRAGRAGTADDAGRQRHLPGLDQGRRGQPLPVLAPTARHEGLGRRRDDGARRPHVLRAHLRPDAGRAHARSGDPIAIAAYLGKKDRFDQSITDFSERYADQNEQDYQAFTEAIRSGRLEALEGV